MFFSALGLGLGALGLGALGLGGASLYSGISGVNTANSALSQSKAAAAAQTAEAQRQFDLNLAWQKAALQKEMDYYERMSNTAHQREVEDLRAAGLNPILSANGGAPTAPVTGSAGVSPTAFYTTPDYLGFARAKNEAMSSAVDGMRGAMDLFSSGSERLANSALSLQKVAQMKDLTPAMKDLYQSQASQAASSASKMAAEARSIQQKTPSEVDLLNANAAYTRLQNTLQSAKTPYARQRAYMQFRQDAANLTATKWNAVGNLFRGVGAVMFPAARMGYHGSGYSSSRDLPNFGSYDLEGSSRGWIPYNPQ